MYVCVFSFYKHILGRKIVFDDIEMVDPIKYKSLRYILDNDIGMYVCVCMCMYVYVCMFM